MSRTNYVGTAAPGCQPGAARPFRTVSERAFVLDLCAAERNLLLRRLPPLGRAFEGRICRLTSGTRLASPPAVRRCSGFAGVGTCRASLAPGGTRLPPPLSAWAYLEAKPLTRKVNLNILTVRNNGKDMKFSSSISSKGQVTVPQEIRKRLGLSTGDRIDFVVEGDRTVIRPSRSEENPFQKYRGILGQFPGGEQGIKDWIDEMRSDEK